MLSHYDLRVLLKAGEGDTTEEAYLSRRIGWWVGWQEGQQDAGRKKRLTEIVLCGFCRPQQYLRHQNLSH